MCVCVCVCAVLSTGVAAVRRARIFVCACALAKSSGAAQNFAFTNFALDSIDGSKILPRTLNLHSIQLDTIHYCDDFCG